MSHGKNSCDGLGGTVKGLAAMASLQCIYTEQIMTPRQLFDWAKGHIKNMNFVYVSQDEILENAKLLQRWHEEAKRVPGTEALHAFIPGVRNNLIMKRFSGDDAVKELQTNLPHENLSLEEIKGFVTCVYNNAWWLGCVMNVNVASQEALISFLHPSGQSPSFVYPQKSDILSIPSASVLVKVDPRTATGRTYTLSTTEIQSTETALLRRRH